jgi:tetratricopeptide (TPR) repeat protein/CHAT domain-containing protein
MTRWLARRLWWVVLFSALALAAPVCAQTATEVDKLSADVTRLYQAGKYSEAIPVAQQVLALREKALGPDHHDVAQSLSDLARLYFVQSRFAEAEPLFKRSIGIYEKALGPDHPDVAQSLTDLARLYYFQRDRYPESEPLYKRAIAIYEKALGPDHPLVGTALNNLAALYYGTARYAEAEPLYKRSLVLREKALGPDHPDVAQSLGYLGAVYRAQVRYAEAEPLYKREITILEKALGPDHPNVSNALNDLARLHYGQGRYAEAELLFKRSFALREKALGPDHPDVAETLSELARVHHDQGHYAEAESLYKRSLALREKALGPDHNIVAMSLNSLAALYDDQGRYTEAEPLYKRSLALREKALGPGHSDVAQSLNNLAALYYNRGRYAEAEPLFKRAITINEKALGPDHPYVVAQLNNLATLYSGQRRYAEAEPLYNRTLALREKTLGPDHPDVGVTLNDLAELYRAQRRYAEAAPLHERSLALREKALGPDHPQVGVSLNNLAMVYQAQGRHAKAEPLYKRSLALREKALGPDHPFVAQSFNNLALISLEQNDVSGAADRWRRATAVLQRRALRGLTDASGGSANGEAQRNSWYFAGLIKTTHRLAAEGRGDAKQMASEMFETAQWGVGSEAASSLAQMAARSAKDSPELAGLVRERQDLLGEWKSKDKGLIAARAEPPARRNPDAERAVSERLAAIDARLGEIDKRLAKDFPDYAALASPRPVATADVQASLRDDEALVLFLDTAEAKPLPEETFVWVVTKADSRWVRSELGTPALRREVATLRCGLDYEGSWSDGHCADLLKIAYTRADHDVFRKPLPFDLARAHALYKELFGPIEDLLKDKRLLIVPSGPLTQLPFHVLVTDPPKTALPTTVAEYKDVAWLAREHAITVLPAVSSLKALRELAKGSRASDAYIGFGDPLLNGDPARFKDDAAAAKLAREKRCEPTLRQRVASLLGLRGGGRSVSRSNGGAVDVADLRTWAPLPETADELCEVAHDLGVDATTHVYLGAAATETKIKQLSEAGALATNKIVHFATHGAVAGEISSATEPGLLLTPPDKASETDDGYLSASEIAGLKLDADWVILSACNTAAGDAKEAEALSGLARAFFYAGARSLLVSHWEVASEPTVKLITKAVDELKHDPKIGRAEALRRSMLAAFSDGKDGEVHPSVWAPFVLVGEGGAAR